MYLLGYDIGTSSVKASLVDALTGDCIGSASYPQSEAPILTLRNGWAEQNPEEWFEYLKEATKSLLTSTGVKGQDIKGIGISYQMHGLVCVDKDLNVLRPAIIWCDSRAVPYGERAFQELGKEFCLSRLLNSPGNFTVAKLAWVKENEPEIFENIYKFMLPGDYIAMKLSGTVNTTIEGLSECMLWDFSEKKPARFLLDFYGIPEEMVAETVPTFSVQAKVSKAAADELWLNPGTPISYRAGDQPNNALSLNVFNPGEVASTAGTSGVVYGISGEVSFDPLSRVNIFAHVNYTPERTRLGIMHCVNGTGILNAWMRRTVAPEGISYPDMNELLADIPVGCDGLTVIPFGNGAERILENKEIGCSIHGINFNKHSKPYLMRAAQEGVAFSFCYGMEIMQNLGMNLNKIHAGNANMFLSPVFRDTLASTSGAIIGLYETDGSVGAAKGAGMGCGIYRDSAEAFASLKKLATIEPDSKNINACRDAYSRWKDLLTTLIKSEN